MCKENFSEVIAERGNMNFKVKRLDNDEVIEQGTNIVSVEVLEGDFVIVKSDGRTNIFDRERFYIIIADCGFLE